MNNKEFNLIFANHYSKVLQYVKSKVNNDETAEDITQEIFIKISKNNFDEEKSKLNTWIFMITNHQIIDHYRCDKSAKLIHVNGYTDDEGNESFEFKSKLNNNNIEEREIYKSIRKAMRKLNNNEQKIANLYFIQQMKYIEISNILEMPVGSVKGFLSRLRKKLQNELKNEYAIL